jgi:hypothetical protein
LQHLREFEFTSADSPLFRHMGVQTLHNILQWLKVNLGYLVCDDLYVYLLYLNLSDIL